MLEVDAIDVHYGPVQALDGVTLTLGAGEMVALLGPNGAGKTTTLRAISGMHHPTRGVISVDGEDVSNRPAHRVVGLGVAHMPQGRELFGDLTVEENLTLGHWVCRKDRVHHRSRREAVFELFPRLAERRRQAAGTLSGGEQQMLTVGRALMSDPKVLLVDEASLGLAPMLVRQLYAAIAEVNRREGTAVLLVDQFIHLALRYTARAYVLERGRIALEGRSDELADSPEVLAAYLGDSTPPDGRPDGQEPPGPAGASEPDESDDDDLDRAPDPVAGAEA